MRPSTSLAEPDPPQFVYGQAHSPEIARLAHAQHSWLLAVLRLRYGRDLAEDLAQETFLRAARTGVPSPLHRPRAWLLKIAINAARDHHRRRAVRPPQSEADRPANELLFGAPAHQDQALLLKQLILSLPPHLRAVFLLSRFEGLTYDEIARRLEISVKTVEWRMSKALAHCTARLRD